jgi:trehalose synthase
VAELTEVRVGRLEPGRFREALTEAEWERFSDLVERARGVLAGRVVWNVNSTASGGGVAELLRSLLAYSRGADVDARWLVLAGDPDFFEVTKRLHNNLHGATGDGGDLGERERRAYESTLEANAQALSELVRAEDVVVLHDPQTAGLVPRGRAAGVPVNWRCHVGLDTPNDVARRAWNFLLPYIREADAYVFSRKAFAWEGLDQSRLALIAPSIDAFSAKNQELSADAVRSILDAAGIVLDGGAAHPTFTREDGSPGRVDSRAEILEAAPLRAGDRVVLQVSRWDRLKDPLGVIEGFVEHVMPGSDAHLVYAGPAVDAVTDDPEGAEVLAEARARWSGLPRAARERVHLACLPMADGEENAAIVNALQRHASVVVQKSIAEGFGLTVAEAMWKARPVVATRIGGIQDQIEDGVSGVLIDDPRDLAAYGAAVRRLLDEPDTAARMGAEAQQRVRAGFLGSRSLEQYFDLIAPLLRTTRG